MWSHGCLHDSCHTPLPFPPLADKFERMGAVVKRYVDGDLKALDDFPVRS